MSRARFGIPVAVLLMAGIFTAWALRTPRLERAWKMHMELRAGERTYLERPQRALLQGALDDYPDLALNMVEEETAGIISQHRHGRVRARHVYLIRTSPRQSRLRIRYAYPKQRAEVEVEGRGRRQTLRESLTPARPLIWDLGEADETPELIELHLVERTPEGKTKTPSVLIEWLETTDS